MSSNFVCIAAFESVPQAHLMRSQLESAGIPVFLRNEHLVSTNSIYGLAAGGVEVMVPKQCAEDALRFLQGEPLTPPLASAARTEDAPSQTDGEDARVCPQCGAPLVRRRSLWPALLALLFCAAWPGESFHWRCPACGKKAR